MFSIEEFKNIVYQYFPRNNDKVYSGFYYDTKEIKELEKLSKKYKLHAELWNAFFLKIKKSLPEYIVLDVSYKYEGWLSRSYGLVVILENLDSKQTVIDLNVSYLIPFYTISLLTFDKLESYKWAHPPSFIFKSNNSEVNDLLYIIKVCAEKIFIDYKEFPTELLFFPIPDIHFEGIKEGDFNFLNAFFINDFRIRF